jgi:parallel beta-helix repeat protein
MKEINNTKLAVIFFIIFIFASGFFISAKASDYDIYVDKSYDEDDSDGSSEKPYKKIEDAIEKGDKIYVKKGTYEERLSLPSGTEIIGESRSETIIKGSAGLPAITAKGNNTLKNLTITGGNRGILFEGKGTIENCDLKSLSGEAISIAQGAGTVTMKKLNVTGNGKGVYAMRNSSYDISDSKFENNSEEGIDIRDKTSGTISGNSISGNKEGGIEIIVGSSDVVIKNNTIKKNKASGIAAQFYSFAKKIGDIRISGNNIGYNGVYGLICKGPSGGDSSKGYYSKSITLTDNKIEQNKRKAISGTCKIAEVVDEKNNETIESETADDVSEEESMKEEEKTEGAEEIRQKIEEQNRILSEEKTALENKLVQIEIDQQESIDKLNQAVHAIGNRNSIKVFLFGPNSKKISAVKEEIEKIKQNENDLNETLLGFEKMEDTENADKLKIMMQEIETQISIQNSLISRMENRFSLFGWVLGIFGK